MSEHAEIINTLAATYNRYDWSDKALGGYLIALSDLDADLLRRAAVEALRTHTGKMPLPADLRRLALAGVIGQPPETDEAWAEVVAAIAHYGYHASPHWTHPLIGQAVEYIGGWGHLCNSKDQTGDRIAFVRTYRTCIQRAEREALMATGLAPAALREGTQRGLPAFRLRHLEEASHHRPALELVEDTRGLYTLPRAADDHDPLDEEF